MSGKELELTQTVDANPILPNKDLSPQEATILWAHKVFDEYSAFPQNNHRQRQRADRYVKGIVSEALQDPQKMGTAGSIWKSREEEVGREKKTFYSHISEKASEIAQENWEDVTSEQLTSIVRVLAHSELASDIARHALTGYFKGPESTSDKVESLYRFTYGALDLIDDKEALEMAVRIGNFQLDILPRSSAFYRDFAIATWTMDNDDILKKAAAIDHIMHQLCYLTTVDAKEVKRDIAKFLRTDAEIKEKYRRYLLRVVKKLGVTELDRRTKALEEYYQLPDDIELRNLEGTRDMARTWPFSVIFRADDPLRSKYNYLVKRRIEGGKYVDTIRGIFLESGEKHFSFIRIIQPDGYSLEIYYPDQLTQEKKSDLIRYVLGRHPLKGELMIKMEEREAIIKELDLPSEPEIRGTLVLDGKVLIFTYHKVSGAEANRHPILSLDSIGFPVPSGRDGLGVSQINETYAKDIKDNQIRFLNRRGIRVPLRVEELQKLGYSYVDFYRDDDKTRVEISVNGLVYQFMLDANYNLDFEGKIFDSPVLADFLRYTVLSLLRPILCDERVKGEKDEEISQEEKEVVTRMGHLRWLPLGQKYTKQAEENYLKMEGGDLAVKNLERKLDAERKSSLHTGHSTTYVKPVMEPEENLPPLVLNLNPNVVTYR